MLSQELGNRSRNGDSQAAPSPGLYPAGGRSPHHAQIAQHPDSGNSAIGRLESARLGSQERPGPRIARSFSAKQTNRVSTPHGCQPLSSSAEASPASRRNCRTDQHRADPTAERCNWPARNVRTVDQHHCAFVHSIPTSTNRRRHEGNPTRPHKAVIHLFPCPSERMRPCSRPRRRCGTPPPAGAHTPRCGPRIDRSEL